VVCLLNLLEDVVNFNSIPETCGPGGQQELNIPVSAPVGQVDENGDFDAGEVVIRVVRFLPLRVELVLSF